MSRESRGWGTTIVAGVGLCGAIVAALVGSTFSWQTAYFIGGGMGLLLLSLRVGFRESGMFRETREKRTPGSSSSACPRSRGSFLALFANRDRAKRYVSVVLVGLPIWFTVGILVGLSPELSHAMGLRETPDPGRSVLVFYVGAAVGDFASGGLSQILESRKKVLGIFLGLTALATVLYFSIGGRSLPSLYASCAFLGAATGYWAVFVTVASEHFGTNLRATATTTAPNFIRGSVVPMTIAFQALKAPLGVTGSAMVVGAVALAIACVALASLEETFGRRLDFVEE